MAYPTIQNGFSAGEMSPRLYGRTDLAKYHIGCSTLRNFYVDYRGGASSRAGLEYVGMCKQGAPNAGGTSTNNPPRDIPFQFNISQGYALEFGDLYMRIKSSGAYVTETAQVITDITQANPGVITIVSHGFSNGDWVFITGVVGMTNFNGLTWIVQNVTTNTFTITDLFGATQNTGTFAAYTSDGTASRIYTVVAPYNAVDLPFLKYTQSADTMTLCCVNQQTNTEYPSYELVRSGATNWAFTADSFTASITAPSGVSVAAHNSTTVSTFYSYVVTAVNASTGEESVASLVGTVENNDIAINAGSNVISWSPVAGAGSYNVYAATPSYSVAVPAGASFGYVGTAFGTQFTDTNIIADFTVVPPVHNDPFSRGQITRVTASASGSSYTQATVGYTIGTTTGVNSVIVPIVVNGGVVSYLIQNGGKSYTAGDTIVITGGGTGSGATATLTIGAQSGTYPGVPAYFQQRRVYAFTLNNPDTYFMSQPGAFSNMDSSIPVTDSDSITGSPWSQQINGIQFLVPMPGGLVVLTGKGAWTLNGGTGAAITPADQTATPQAYNGCHFHIPPIVVNYDILYVQAKGSIVRDLSYNFFVNIYTGTDMTVLSDHLFEFHQIQQWAYVEEPYKLIWCVRDDGILLSLTYLKEQDVYAWARHDTNGIFLGVCSITEPPVDALYVIVQRYIKGPAQWVYYSERMDNRNWQTVEDCFCVDSGLRYTMTFPNGVLTPSRVIQANSITDVNIIYGGTGYTNPSISAVDPTGVGSGLDVSVIGLTDGVITDVIINNGGVDYAFGTYFVIYDATGSGAIIAPIITNIANFSATNFSLVDAQVGDVIRIGNNNAAPSSGFALVPNGGGKAIVTDQFEILANVTEPITNIIPDDPNETPIPVQPNYWSITTPVSSISGLNHLEGMAVSILADGNVVTGQTVTNGAITLPTAATAIAIGLPYTPQLQTLYLDPAGQPTTTQGKRKIIPAVTVRMEKTRGISVGVNQPDAATQPNGATVPWTKMTEMKQRTPLNYPGTALPLYTGDLREHVIGEWDKPAQIAVQQTYPLPANITALLPEASIGDSSG